MNGVEGFMYPNEIALQWSVLIVLYPFITGLVAGAFILASLERVFRVEAVKPTYRLALLTALAFLLVAPLPLQLHLGHPERSPEMYFTPHSTSAMAMFGYVYLWYLMAVLVLEIWLDYRRDIVLLSQSSKGLLRFVYKVMTLGSSNISPRSLAIDDRVGWIVTLIGIPSAFLLHGYVGFIFGSIKANPWWSSPLMPVVFIFSAMVSGIAGVMLLYMALTKLRKQVIDMRCVDSIAMYLLYLHHRLQPGDAGPDSPHLRGGRILPQPQLHGPHPALHSAYRDSDLPGNADAADFALHDAGGQVQ
jgi:Ni/Fe-hydrogenase subunit HybB-like protein